MADKQPKETNSPPDQAQLALERTWLAHERTLMAWVRTGISLVTFGFGMFKFFEYVSQQDPAKHPYHVLGPRTMGMTMIVIGVATLALATFQHHQNLKKLRAHYPQIPFSPALFLAALMSLLGLLALLAPLI